MYPPLPKSPCTPPCDFGSARLIEAMSRIIGDETNGWAFMSLSRIWVVATNVFKEVIRDRVLYLVALYAVLCLQ